MAVARRSGGKTTLTMASANPSCRANASPTPARATIKHPGIRCGCRRSTPKTTVPISPSENIRFMPYLSPSAPAPSTPAARDGGWPRRRQKLAVPEESASPSRTAEMFADRITGSAAVMLAPSPVARIVIVAAVPDTHCGWVTAATT